MAWLDTEVHIKNTSSQTGHTTNSERQENANFESHKALDNDWLKQRIHLFMEEKIAKYVYKNLNLKALNISQEN